MNHNPESGSETSHSVTQPDVGGEDTDGSIESDGSNTTVESDDTQSDDISPSKPMEGETTPDAEQSKDEIIAELGEILGIDDPDQDNCIEEVERLVETHKEIKTQNKQKDDRIEDLNTQLTQEREEFQQFREQREERLEQDRKRQVENMFADLSEVHTTLFRALNDDHDDIDSFHSGVKMVFDEFESVFESENVECVIPDEGDIVDPQLHNVVTSRETEHKVDTIIEVYEPGYIHGETVLKPASVVVST